MKPLPRLLALLLALTSVAGGCRREEDVPADGKPTDGEARALPPFELRDDTERLLLTWVDEQGDFHVVQKVADVPEANRKTVRVVVTNREAGTGELLYVADLSQKRTDGTYPVRSMSRSEWNEIGAARRKARLEALAPSAAPANPAPAPAVAGETVAVLYGASWCKACRDAARFLKQRGIRVLERDIEKDPAAEREMRQKLKQHGIAGGGIPVIEIMGKVVQGFNTQALEQALKSARTTQTL
jgi:glutaredoxin